MKKSLLAFAATALLLLVSAPKAQAIITDPDDYLIYDSGPIAPIGVLANAPDTFIFDDVTAVKMIKTDGVSFRKKKAPWGRGINDDQEVDDMGFTGQSWSSSTLVSDIWINEDTKSPYHFTALEWKKKQNGCTDSLKTSFRWWNNSKTSEYNRPSDSLIVRIPNGCDSIFIQAGGTNVGYGVLVYQKELGLNKGYYSGGNWGQGHYNIGFKPAYIEGQDSVDIVILAPMKDWFVGSADKEWTDSSPVSFTQVALETALDTYWRGERWGLFSGTGINRIKIYGTIDKGEVPEFDGTVFGWTDKFTPKTTGTVDLEQPITESDVPSRHQKYASDLGIVRFMMTQKGSTGMLVGYNSDYAAFATTIDLLSADTVDAEGYAVKIDTITYEDEVLHRNYLQLSGAATGCQDMKIDFDFAIAGGNQLAEFPDSICVAVQKKGSSSWKVLGFVPAAYDASPEENPVLKHVTMDLPNDVCANNSFNLRILVSYLETAGASLTVANLKVSGYDDYHAKDSGAKTIGYITSATDRLHILKRATTADSTDMLLKSLMEGSTYKVKLFTQAETASLDSEEAIKEAFKDCNLVVLSEYPGSGDNVVKNAKYLIGYKPFLNMKAFAYKNWGMSNFKQTDGASDSLAVVGSNFMIHPLFNGISLETDSLTGILYTPKMFSDCSLGTKFFQGFTYTDEPEGYVIARGANSDAVCIYEDYSNDAAKYMMLAISGTQNNNLKSAAKTLFNNAVSYLLSGGHFEAPDFNLTTTGAIVESTEELKAAMAYDFTVIGISEPVILMKGGEYLLDSLKTVGKGKITLKPYDSSEVVCKGTFEPVSMNLKSVTFNGIIFEGENITFSFTGLKTAKLSEGLYVDDCIFDGVAGLFTSEGADSCSLNTLSVQNSIIRNISVAKELIKIDQNSCIDLDNIVFSENVVANVKSSNYIYWGGRHQNTRTWDSKNLVWAVGDSVKSLTVENNAFISDTEGGSMQLVTFCAQSDTVQYAHFEINNNIFYNSGNIVLNQPEMPDSSYVNFQNNLLVGSTTPNIVWNKTVNDLTLASLGESSIFADNNFSLQKTSAFYTGGKDRKYLGPISIYEVRSEPVTTIVHNVPELKTALEIAIGGDVIELADYEMSDSDSIAAYILGQNGFSYGIKDGGTLTVKPAEGANPVIFGNIAPNNSVNADAIVFDGLAWVDSTRFPNYDKEVYGPFYFNNVTNANIGRFVVRNCNFSDQQAQVIMRIKDGCTGLYVGSVLFENNRIENQGGTYESGTTGGHIIQFSAKEDFSLNNFTFVNNVVSNFHGSQVFNIARGGAANGDSIYNINISNNLFYKFGGNAKDKVRNFVEFHKTPSNSTVNMNIDNNIFYKRWATDNNPVAYVTLWAPDTTVVANINIRNNFFEGKYYTGEETLTPNPVAITNNTENLIVVDPSLNVDEVVAVNRENELFMSTLNIDHVFVKESELLISDKSPLYTAGVGGTYLGPDYLYADVEDIADAVRSIEAERLGLNVCTANGQVFVSVPEAAGMSVFTLMGQKVLDVELNAGVTCIDGLQAGSIYLLRVKGAAVKVMVK